MKTETEFNDIEGSVETLNIITQKLKDALKLVGASLPLLRRAEDLNIFCDYEKYKLDFLFELIKDEIAILEFKKKEILFDKDFDDAFEKWMTLYDDKQRDKELYAKASERFDNLNSEFRKTEKEFKNRDDAFTILLNAAARFHRANKADIDDKTNVVKFRVPNRKRNI